MKSLLTFTCIGHKEVDHLKELLPQLLKTGCEVVYVDCESEDGSFELAESLGCKAFRRQNTMNLNVNKSYTMEQVTTPWIFYVDPDERFSPELLAEIESKISGQSSSAAFKLQRRNHYFGKWLRHGGQFPDTQLRLFQKDKGRFPNKHVHESLKIDGAISRLQEPMDHYPYLSISQYLKKFDFYSSFEAQYLYDKGLRPGFSTGFKYLIWKPKARFFRRYLFKGGFRDGLPGLFAALFDALGWATRYFKLWEIHNKKTDV